MNTDEARECFTSGDRAHVGMATRPGLRDRAISCFTFIKTQAMAGRRIGRLHATPEWIPRITKAHIPFARCAPTVSQYAALAAPEGPRSCVDVYRAHYLPRRDLICARLDRLLQSFTYLKHAGSYLGFPRIVAGGGQDSRAFCKRLRQAAKVSTTPGVALGPTGERHLGCRLGLPEETIDAAVDRLEACFAD